MTGKAGAPVPADLAQVREIARTLQLAKRVDQMLVQRPYLGYRPGKPGVPDADNGQLQFHRARHTVRFMPVGNGWGKTHAVCVEYNAWARHTNRWQKTPPWPVKMVHFPKQETQWELIWPEMYRKIFGPEVIVLDDGKHFTWPDGSTLTIGLADTVTAWKKYQGIEADLIGLDEHKPWGLWRELTARKRGMRDTRYIIGATQTEGITWMKEAWYDPWLAHHTEAGLSEEQAMRAQTHPQVWCWPRGGIHDNPVATDDQIAWQRSQTWTSEKEKKVRLYGGFESWIGDGVFDEDALAELRAWCESAAEKYGEERTGCLEIDHDWEKRERQERIDAAKTIVKTLPEWMRRAARV
jgi:hypothetical protein